MSTTSGIWPKKITVDKRIVTILSGSTYDNFPKALKELITNSYDADASEVKILIDPKSETIIVEDNGWGMSEGDFDFYLRIAGKSRTSREYTLSGRKRIGQFGVGFLSVFPFCRNYNIESKKKGSPEILFASIPNHRFFHKDEKKVFDVDEIPIQGGKRRDNSQINKQFTRIKLTGFTDLTKAFFKQAYYVQRRRDSILQYPAIKRLEWELCEDLPIEYSESSELNDLFEYKKTLPFRVYLNSETNFLIRNVHAKSILETHKGEFEKIGKIKFKYFISTDYKPVKPVEGRYLKLRNFNVGVGERKTFGVGLEGRTFARLAHLTGEIHILEGMNDLINVSRDDFNFSPDYEELQEFFRAKLRKWGYELDKISDAEKFIKESEDRKHIKNIQVLDKSSVKKKFEELEKKGFNISKTKTSNSSSVKIDKGKKQVTVSQNEDEDDLTKTIEINKKSYKLKLDTWDTSESFPACKLKGRTITINGEYPFFSSKNKRYLDIFIKIHALLLINLEANLITTKAYKNLLRDFESTFGDYIT